MTFMATLVQLVQEAAVVHTEVTAWADQLAGAVRELEQEVIDLRRQG